MGKGSNVQKAQAARERNQKKQGKSDEERKAALEKVKKDSAAYMCLQCRQTFMINAKLPVLYLHVTSRHEPGTDPVSCFPCLAAFDPNDPKGEKKAAADAQAKAAKKKSSKKANNTDLDSLLDAGLSKTKTKKKK